jgi:signal transduction histidine kinase
LEQALKLDVLTAVKRSPFVFPLACLAVLAMVFISEGSYWQSVTSLDQIRKMSAARSAILDLTQSIVDAESGQRGYLLTDHKEYLEPYDVALSRIAASFNLLDSYYGDDPGSREVVQKLHRLTETKLSELALAIRLRAEGKGETSRDLVLSGIGKEKMEAIRLLGAGLLRQEDTNVAAARDAVYHTLMLSRVGVAGLSVISLLALFLYLRQSSAFEKQLREQKRLVQAERDRLEIEVLHRTTQLTELTQHLQTAREDERSRLARDLHDELGALLTSAKLDAARIKSRLAGTAPEALERLAHLIETLNSGIALKRRIIEDLRPSALSNLGLVATLEILVREYADRSGVQAHCALQPVKLEATAELVVYRMVQEAITNITKYAQARNVWVELSKSDGQVEVSVRDDGVGFDPKVQRGSAHGLVGMRFRVEAEGGVLTVESNPGKGTRVRARLPESVLQDADTPLV